MLSQILAATALPVFEKNLDQPELEKPGFIAEPTIESKAFPHRRWPLHTSAESPVYNPQSWNLRIFGTVQDELQFAWNDLQQLPAAEALFDPSLTSMPQGARYWQGFELPSLLALAGVRGDAEWVIVHSEGGYNRILELDRILEGPALLATKVDNGPIDTRSGGPARLILPHFDARFSAQWVRGLELRSDLP